MQYKTNPLKNIRGLYTEKEGAGTNPRPLYYI